MSDPALSHRAATAEWPKAVLDWVGSIPFALRDHVDRVERVWLPASAVPWTETGIVLGAGQWFSLFATGRVLWTAARGDQWAGPRHHLWGRIGKGPVFNPTQDILRKAVDLPLDADTRIVWRWRVDEFPSALAEDEVSTHDYLSVAVEFDDGRDLTWFWSRCLEVDTHFGCPVRSWNHREVHYCVRSGDSTLGTWQREQRPIAADCAEALGEVPRRLAAVWLIVVSTFQHGVARGAFADIRLETPGSSLRVL